MKKDSTRQGWVGDVGGCAGDGIINSFPCGTCTAPFSLLHQRKGELDGEQGGLVSDPVSSGWVKSTSWRRYPGPWLRVMC